MSPPRKRPRPPVGRRAAADFNGNDTANNSPPEPPPQVLDDLFGAPTETEIRVVRRRKRALGEWRKEKLLDAKVAWHRRRARLCTIAIEALDAVGVARLHPRPRDAIHRRMGFAAVDAEHRQRWDAVNRAYEQRKRAIDAEYRRLLATPGAS